MGRPFPLAFTLRSLTGPRGSQFSEREDAFQQLVGDWLRESCGMLGVHVAPTEGRDGSIDVFVEDHAGGQAVLDLACPTIVECKDHSEAGKDLRKNVLDNGWGKVEEKLTRKALAGWPSEFAPWRRARGYLYCVSARLTHSLRDALEQRIAQYFAALPDGVRPPIEKTRVLDWDGLRAQLDTSPVLSDRWVGTGLETLRTHEAQLASLSGFRACLLPDRLSFVAPDPWDPVHPARLLEQLQRLAGQRGVLLVGPGGVGKTRTLLEVGTLAVEQGWRVLHAQPGEPHLTNEELAEVVLEGSGPTMVLLDYLDQMALDQGSMRRRLLPAARERGIKLALLADARPAQRDSGEESPALFETVELRPAEERQRRITDGIVHTLAAAAVAQLGHARVRELCGERPIFALFVARELEQLALAGALNEERLHTVRPGELVDWLRLRLRESDLFVTEPASKLQPSRPEPELVAAAAVLGTAPRRRSSHCQTAERTLAAQRPSLQQEELLTAADHLVAVLERHGWLERRGVALATPHDAVADEVLADVLRSRPSGALRQEAVAPLLAPALTSVRSLGRLALSLRRLTAIADEWTAFSAELGRCCGSWLVKRAAELGERILSGAPDEVSYALGSVLAWDTWREATRGCWDELVSPWLVRHARAVEARHILYRGLSTVEEGHATDLVEAALTWLNKHATLGEASYVLQPLLERADLEEAAAKQAVSRAIAWLNAHATLSEAPFVLKPLLERGDLEAAAVRQAVGRALAWLSAHATLSEASYVLQPLLERADLEEAAAKQAVSLALAWLSAHATLSKAQFVLQPLLERGDLPVSIRYQAIHLASSWLESNAGDPNEDFVICPLMDVQNLPAGARARVMSAATRWLDGHRDAPKASFVFRAVLKRRDLSPEEIVRISVMAAEWLERHAHDRNAEFVTNALLRNPHLPNESLPIVAQVAFTLLTTMKKEQELDFMLGSLFRRLTSLTPEQQARLAERACDCLHSPARIGEPLFDIAQRICATAYATAGSGMPILQRCISCEGPPPAEGKVTPSGHRRTGFFQTTFAIDRCVEIGVTNSADLPDFVSEAAIRVKEQLSKGHVASAGYALPGLMVLAARSQDPLLRQQVESLVRQFLDDPRLAESNRRGFAAACYRLVDKNAWPEAVEAGPYLVSLGVHRRPSDAD